MAWYHVGARSKLRKLSPSNIVNSIRVLDDEGPLLLDWVNRGLVRENWGDAIAPVLVRFLSGRRVVNRRDTLNLRRRPVYSAIGSMLGSIADANWIVWGSGFVDSKAKVRTRPAAVCAVRGPLTRRKLLEQGVSCPEIYGDPALLTPLLYSPSITPSYRLGVIPHWNEQRLDTVNALRQIENVKVIDIRGGITEVIDDIHRCERIVSSALHGLVAADAYGIPTRWIRFSDRPAGDGFKVYDYLASVGRVNEHPIDGTVPVQVDELTKSVVPVELKIDLEAFRNACPFLDEAGLKNRSMHTATETSCRGVAKLSQPSRQTRILSSPAASE